MAVVSETLSVVGPRRSPADRRAPCLHIGLHADAPRSPPARISLHEIDAVTVGRGDTRSIRRTGRELAIVLADPQLSRRHARFERVGEAWVVEDLDSKNGTRVCGRAP
jgi:FHA domain